MAIGYSVTDGTATRPGIRYAGRLSTDPLGQLSQRRGHARRRHRRPDPGLEPLGGLLDDVDRPLGRLHVLVLAGVLQHDRRHELADAHRVLQVPAVRALAELAPLAESGYETTKSADLGRRSSRSGARFRLFGSVRDLDVHLVVVPAFIPDGDLARSALAFP